MSASVSLNLGTQTIDIKAVIILYGNLASDEMAQNIEKEINEFWNQPYVSVFVKKESYKVNFEINVIYRDTNQVRAEIALNKSHVFNYVRVEKTNKSARSMMGFSLGENSGHWLESDNLGYSTTAAHEFGHALGLPHPEITDYRGTGLPPIMAPRGTLVDPVFQWNPLADAGTPGGTLRPIYRRVRKEEVEEVIKPIDFNKNSEVNIGKITNYFFDEIGNIII